MPLFRRPVPRRAAIAAALGALTGLLALPTPAVAESLAPAEAAWFYAQALLWLGLSVWLLFLKPLAYHAFATWGLVWGILRFLSLHRGGQPAWLAVLDVAPAAAAVLLLMTSRYLVAARAAAETS